MKKQDFEAINNALIRVATGTKVHTTENEDLMIKGVIMGIMMWLDEYYEKHKEE